MPNERPVADLTASDTGEEPSKTRYVKTSTGMIVELGEDLPDELAEAMAQAMKTKKGSTGYYDEAMGKIIFEVQKNIR